MNRSLYRLCFRSLLFQIKTPSSSSSSSSPGFLPAFLPSRHGLHSSRNPLQQAAAAERLPEEELPDDDFIPELGRRPCLKVKRLADEMASLSVLEISDVGDLLRKRLRISGTMMMTSIGSAPSAGPGPGAPQDEKKAEKTSFDIKIEKYDPAAKIKVIKEVRAITALGLKEAKELVEKVPAVVKTGLTKEEAEEMVAKLKTAGAIVVLE